MAVIVVVAVTVTVVMVVMVMEVMAAVCGYVVLLSVEDGGSVFRMVLFVIRGYGGCSGCGRRDGSGSSGGRGGRIVVFTQAADSYASVGSSRAAHAVRRAVVVIVLARRQAAALHQEQRTTVGVQQRADVLQDFVAQRPHVQFIAYVFHLCRTQQ